MKALDNAVFDEHVRTRQVAVRDVVGVQRRNKRAKRATRANQARRLRCVATDVLFERDAVDALEVQLARPLIDKVDGRRANGELATLGQQPRFPRRARQRQFGVEQRVSVLFHEAFFHNARSTEKRHRVDARLRACERASESIHRRPPENKHKATKHTT